MVRMNARVADLASTLAPSARNQRFTLQISVRLTTCSLKQVVTRGGEAQKNRRRLNYLFSENVLPIR